MKTTVIYTRFRCQLTHVLGKVLGPYIDEQLPIDAEFYKNHVFRKNEIFRFIIGVYRSVREYVFFVFLIKKVTFPFLKFDILITLAEV